MFRSLRKILAVSPLLAALAPVLLSAAPPPNDNFANAQVLVGNSGRISGTNVEATGEPGEPIHYQGSSSNKTSVWYRWIAPQDGSLAVLVRAPGVSIRPAAYTGAAIFNLSSVTSQTPVTIDGVSGTCLTVAAGTTYFFALGSYAEFTSPFEVNWEFTRLPIITSIAAVFTNNFAGGTSAGTVQVGGTAFISTATVVSAFPLAYQWSRNGTPISGATTIPLQFNNPQLTDAGSYTLTATNSFGQATSSTAVLRVVIPAANDNLANAQLLSGLSGSITDSNTNATAQPREPGHANTPWGAQTSVWYRWIAPASGLATIDTIGSDFDTVLAVYDGVTFDLSARIAADNDSGGNLTSRVSFSATIGATYSVVVAGPTEFARGNIKLNWLLRPILAIVTPPASQTVAVGSSASFSVTATGNAVTYQWNRNGVPIPGATNPSFVLANAQAGADASFTVTVRDSTGALTSAPAALSVALPAITPLTSRYSGTGLGHLWSIAGNGSTLVAVGEFGAIVASTDSGRTWSPRVSRVTNWLVGVTFGAGQFVAVGERGIILRSADGLNWMTPPANSGTTERLNNILHAGGQFVAVGEGGTILTSLDAGIWTTRISGTANWLRGLAYHPRLGAFAVSGRAGSFLTSTDGATWTEVPIGGLTQDLEATVAVESYAHFVSIGSGGIEASVSRTAVVLADGEKIETWTGELNPTGSTARFRGLAQGAGALFATGEGGRIVTAFSDAGPWFNLSSGTIANLVGGLFHNDTLFIVGEDQTILQSAPLFASRLANISTRARVGAAGDLMISGFVVSGAQPKQMLIRAAGPALAGFGLAGTLAAPSLRVVDAQGAALAGNTGWSGAPNSAAIAAAAARVGAFAFAPGSADSAVLVTLPPGAYTAQVSGVTGSTGLALVEAYDADPAASGISRAINISTRSSVAPGADKLIAGFVIDGASARRVLIRAIGPGLAAFGVGGPLAAPQLELYTARGNLQTTAGAWNLQPNADEIRAATDAVGAFRLAEQSRDSALLLTLLPGAWTVQVGGANNTTGIALVEVYDVP